MNGKENGILQAIRDDIKKTQEAIEKNQGEVSDLKANFAETRADVKNLVGWVDNINTRIEKWNNNGCPHGQVNATEIANNKESIKDLKEEVKEFNVSGKKAAAIASGSAAFVVALIKIIGAFFTEGK